MWEEEEEVVVVVFVVVVAGAALVRLISFNLYEEIHKTRKRSEFRKTKRTYQTAVCAHKRYR